MHHQLHFPQPMCALSVWEGETLGEEIDIWVSSYCQVEHTYWHVDAMLPWHNEREEKLPLVPRRMNTKSILYKHQKMSSATYLSGWRLFSALLLSTFINISAFRLPTPHRTATLIHSTTPTSSEGIVSYAAPDIEINRRRNLAIISHPDSGKTTMTEKLLLYGGALQTAGAVRMKGEQRATKSDFMEMEKQRGISIR